MNLGSANMPRAENMDRLYDLIGDLEEKCGGKRHLWDIQDEGGMDRSGLYFMFEPDEVRSDNTRQMRITRVGRSDRPLGERLADHWPSEGRKRKHIASVLRKHIGGALIVQSKGELLAPSWGAKGIFLSEMQRAEEAKVEVRVSEHLKRMQLLWLCVDSAVSRGFMESNLIRLLSNGMEPLDPPSESWLGRWHPQNKVRESGLWNSHYVTGTCEAGLLKSFSRHVGN